MNVSQTSEEVPHTFVLIVDDDRLILATLGKGLRNAGYEVREAVSGDEALQICAQRRPDLVLLDARMPEMSGLDVARALRAIDVPFMFLSAYGDQDVVREAVEQGAYCYLVKPVDVPQVVPAIEAALVRAAQVRQLKESERNLNTALASGREISMAIGVIMERYRLSESEAFESLRSYARSHRRKLADVAADVVRASDRLNLPLNIRPRSVKRGEDDK